MGVMAQRVWTLSKEVVSTGWETNCNDVPETTSTRIPSCITQGTTSPVRPSNTSIIDSDLPHVVEELNAIGRDCRKLGTSAGEI